MIRSKIANTLRACTTLFVICTTVAALGAESDGASPTTPAGTSMRVMVIAAEALTDAAHAWRTYREEQGWQVELHVLTSDSPEEIGRAQISEWITRAVTSNETSGASSVLLLGDSDALPTWRFEQKERVLCSRRDSTYVSDHPYQTQDGSELPLVALGRVPARSNQEAFALLDKIRTYESVSTGAWRKRITFVAGRGRFGAADWLLESMFRTMVRTLVPSVNDVSMTYASVTSKYCPPPCCVREEVTHRMNEGALLFNYIGHGSATALDRLHWRGGAERIFDRSDLDNVTRMNGSFPIALLTCCSSGWFDLSQGQYSLAEAMLFSSAGPIAVIAGSRMTHPYANTVFQKDVIEQLLGKRRETIGQLDLFASQSLLTVDDHDRQIDLLAAPLHSIMRVKCSLKDLRTMHVRLYNLLGDPCTRIPHLRVEGISLALDEEDTLRVSVPGMARGAATISVETDIEASAWSYKIDPVNGPDDVAFPEKAAKNYPAANQRSFVTIVRVVTGEQLEVSLANAIPDKARFVKVYAEGFDADGNPMDCAGSLELKTPSQNAPASR